MINSLEIINATVRFVAERFVDNSVGWIQERRLEYRQFEDAEIQAESRSALANNVETYRTKESGFLPGIVRFILRLFGKSTLDPLLLDNVALAIEGFSRAPADLPPGTQLYPEQVRASIALTQSCVLQMSTGEGKTYALLPAAYGLTCKHGRVFVLCANSYLAWRDAKRTSRFWEYMGVSVGYCESAVSGNWSRRVIYTTFKSLMFRCLNDELQTEPPADKHFFAALILDEVDSILFDDFQQSYSVVEPIRSESFDWGDSIEFARTLREELHVTVDRNDLTATLTPDGETLLRQYLEEHLRKTKPSATEFLTYRHAVELAFIASSVAVEDHHYIVEGNHIHTINLATGQIERNIFPGWIAPLEFMRGMPPRPYSRTKHILQQAVFLDSFSHVSGLSGTVVEDAVEYLFSFYLPTVRVAPRFQRHRGLQDDLVYLTEKEAVRAVIDQALKANKIGRPVLIGTQSISHAQLVFAALSTDAALPATATVHVLTGLDDKRAAEVFEQAGQPGSIVVATQLAGRGVDIRLTEAARAAGGSHLVCMGHSQELRRDLQLLGRVGRHGDPFTAVFVCSLDDTLFRYFASDRVRNLMKGLGMEQDEAIEHAWVTRAIKNAQSKVRQHNFWNRRFASLADYVWSDIRSTTKTWIDYQQRVDFRKNNAATDGFLRWTIDHMLQYSVEPILRRSRVVTKLRAEDLLLALSSRIPLGPGGFAITVLDIEGLTGDLALKYLKELLLRQSKEMLADNHKSIMAMDAAIADHYKRGELIRAKVRQLRNQFYRWGPETAPRKYSSLPTREDDSEPAGLEELSGSLADTDFSERTEFHELIDSLWENIPIVGFSGRTSSSDTLMETIEMIGRAISTADGSPSESVDAIKSLTGPESQAVDETTIDDEEHAVTMASLPEEDRMLSKSEALDQLDALKRLVKEVENGRPKVIEWQRYRGRDGNQLVYVTFFDWWSRFLEEAPRIRHKASHAAQTVRETAKLVSKALKEHFEKEIADLPGRILRAVAMGRNPKELDDVFWMYDHRTVGRAEPVSKYEWDDLEIEAHSLAQVAFDEKERIARLVSQFLATGAITESSGHDKESVKQVLGEFLTMFPLMTLQTPDSIQDVFEGWMTYEVRRGVVKERRALHRKWILLLLAFLNKRGLVGPLPRWHHKAKSWLIRLCQSSTESHVLIPGSLALVGLLLFVVVSWGVLVVDPILMPGAFGYADAAVFGGLLSLGSISAPGIGAIVLTALITQILFPSSINSPRGVGLEAMLVASLQMALGGFMLYSSYVDPTVVDYLSATLVFVGMFFVARILLMTAWTIENEFGLSLVSVWLGFTTILVVLPRIATDLALTIALYWVIACSFAALLYFFKRSNTQEVVLVATRFVETQTQGEKITAGALIHGYAGSLGHISSLLLALSFFQLATVLEVPGFELMGSPISGNDAVALLVYVCAVFWWNRSIVKSRLSPGRWEMRLNRRRQLMQGYESVEARNSFLEKTRKKLTTRSQVFEVLTIAAVMYVVYESSSEHGVALGLLLICTIHVFVEHFTSAVSQLSDLIRGRVRMSFETVDLSNIDEPKERLTFFERIARMVENRVMRIFGLLIFFVQALILILDAWNLMDRFVLPD